MNLADDPRFVPGPDSPCWLAAMGMADLEAERYLERQEYIDFLGTKSQYVQQAEESEPEDTEIAEMEMAD